MDYEKKYNEALERAKAYHRNELAGSRKEMTEYIFPELRESEDERIRKDICVWLKHKRETCIYPTPKKETLSAWIAYLEKQKELNHDGKKWIYQDDYLKVLDCRFNDGKNEVLENPEKYGFQKKQKPAEWSEEDEERLIKTSISFLKDFADKGYENAVECVDWLKSKLNGNSGK